MTMLNDKRLELLVQQEQERISESQPRNIDLSIIQARCLCWLVRLAERHEYEAMAAEKRRDTEQAMGWYADSYRIKDVINLIMSIEIPNLNDYHSSDLEEDYQESLLTQVTEEKNIIFETLDYTHDGIKNTQKRSQLENLQIQKKIDSLSDKSNKIEELLKINNQKLNQINEQLLDNKKVKEVSNNDVNSEDKVVYAACRTWAEKTYNGLKKKC